MRQAYQRAVIGARRPFSPEPACGATACTSALVTLQQRSLPSLPSRTAARGDGHAAAVAATRTRPAERRPNDIARIYRAFPARTPTSSRPLLLVCRGRRGGKGAQNGPARAGLVRASAPCFLRPRQRARGVRRTIRSATQARPTAVESTNFLQGTDPLNYEGSRPIATRARAQGGCPLSCVLPPLSGGLGHSI